MANSEVTPLSSVLEAIDAFESSRSWHKDGKHFHPDNFEKEAEKHVKQHSLVDRAPMNSNLCSCGGSGTQAIVIEQVATYKNVSFFIDSVSLTVHSVMNEAMCQVMIRRGYQQINVHHHTSLETLPSPISEKKDAESLPAPSIVKVPSCEATGSKLPMMWRADDETFAKSLVRAFEEKFVAADDQNQPQAVYSPIWMWTKDIRQANKVKDSKFTNWCKSYYYIREIKKEVDPNNISESPTAMRSRATDHNPTRGRGGKQERVDWWEQAAVVAKRIVSGS